MWLGCTVWSALKLDELCAELMPSGRERIAWALLAAVLVIARLTERCAASCTSPRIGIARPLLKTCSGYRPRAFTTIVYTARWVGRCRASSRARLQPRPPARLQAGLHRPVVTREGMPLGYEVFAGNRHDATTAEEIVTTMGTPAIAANLHVAQGT